MKQMKRKRRLFAWLLLGVMAVGCLSGCGKKESADWRTKDVQMLDDNYRTWYEIFVYSFCDSDGDGIGDLRGVMSKLDYIEEMGFNGIWLMPVMASITYHKYDVVDYYSIDSEYGTMVDMDMLIEECNDRGIKLILDLAMNHTSSSHEWFVAACDYLKGLDEGEEPSAEECKYYGYYNFQKGNPSSDYWYRVGTTDYYYEGKFVSSMPDLNLENEVLQADLEAVMKFWLDKGVGGFRLDAVKEFYSGNTEKNIEILTWINDYVKSVKPDAYLVGEMWDTSNLYSQYYASGIDSFFNFEFANATGVITKTLTYIGEENNAQAYAKALVRSQELLRSYREDAIDAPFYANHDLARGAGMLRYDERKIKMGAALNILMSGSAFVYYGEEIAMTGSGKDENKRAPMFWSADENAKGMTHGPLAMEPQENRFPSLEEQQADPNSIWNFFKDTILLRNQNPEIARGTVARLEEITDGDIAAISKTWNGTTIYLLYNLSETDEKQVTLSKDSYAYKEIAGYLSADGGEVTLKGDTVTLPAYSVVVLR